MPTPWTATIIKFRSDDGNWVLADNSGYEVGQPVEVDLDTRRVQEFSRNGKKFQTEVIELAEETSPRMLFPTELLEI